MNIRIVDEISVEYPLFERWWKAHGWMPVPMSVLPRLGVVAEDQSGPVAAGWLYMDNSVGVSMLEWLVADPEASPRRVAAGLLRITEFLKLEAKENGYGVMLATCRQESLSKLLQRSGFHETDQDVIHLLTVI